MSCNILKVGISGSDGNMLVLYLAGLSHVKTIAPDSWGHMWAIIDDMKKDSDLTAAIDVIGTHQECYGAAAQMPPPVRLLDFSPFFEYITGWHPQAWT